MGFSEDVASNPGQLNAFLADKSYIEGFTPSQADTVVFKAFSSAPSAEHKHALRWYNHIASYGSEVASFPGEAKPLTAYGGSSCAPKAAATEDDDVDLFGDEDEEDEEAEAERKKVLASYYEKKAKKPTLVAKSTIILDVKPWDDETDLAEMERLVREISADGLLWGASKLVEVGYGIKKLQITCVVEDDKVGTDLLDEQITGLVDHVQSVDIVAFNKI